MSFLDWLYIIGGLILLLVLVDGLRRMNSNWKQKVRLKVKGEQPENEFDARDEVALLRGELPNGGARVVRAEPFISSPEPDADNGLEQEAEAEVFVDIQSSVDEVIISASAQDSDSAVEASVLTSEMPLVDESPVENPSQEMDSVIEDKPVKTKKKSALKAKPVTQKQLDFSDALFATKDDLPPPKKAKQSNEIEEIVVIHIEVPASEAVTSQQLIPLLKDNGMKFGEMGIFHRQDDRNIASTPLFSLANSREPGTFDIESKEGFDVSGLTLFFTLPGPDDPVVAIDEMIKLAEILKIELQAEWLDSGRNPLNTQILEHLRQKVRDFKLQHPA